MRVLTITVKPSSKHNSVVPTGKDTFDVHTSASLEKGKANREMIKVLAHFLGVSPSKLLLTAGEKYQEKTILMVD